MWTGAVLLVIGLAALGWAAWTTLRPPVDAARAAADVAALRGSWAEVPAHTPSVSVSPSASASTPATPAPTASPSAMPTTPGVPATAATPSAGQPVAILRVPALGVELPVFAGTSDAVLARGAGWYSGTAPPGEVGNLGLAAHGGPRGPLAGLAALQPGAEVVVETRAATFTYVLTNVPGASQVANTDFWVLDPVPGRPGERPTDALVTVTTSFDGWSSPRRMVAWGRLERTDPRPDAAAARR